MVVPYHVAEMLRRVRARFGADGTLPDLGPKPGRVAELRPTRDANAGTLGRMMDQLGLSPDAQAQLADTATLATAASYSSNIESMVGTVKVPVGVIGPLQVNGLNANGAFPIPLATTEAALVASYGRGARAANRAGGIATAVLYEGVLRTPAFVTSGLVDSGRLVDWIVNHTDAIIAAAEATTRHGRLVGLEPAIDNDIVFLICRYTTGDAAGQNMVTIATDALCRVIARDCPVPIRRWYVEGNFSGDKKASHLGKQTGRGRKVSASVVLPDAVIERVLRCRADDMLDYARVAGLGALLSGQLGAQAHYANGLAALYIATGQDAACVAESAVGFTRMERREDGLFCAVTMPNILVGTVGGGTGLPSQSACLEMMGLAGAGHAAALAEIAAALCLCGEISIVAAMAAGHFAGAHEKLARQR
ncbi:MAG: 3-hydroxy-3-methylglutaryl-CoA reductase [Pseudomonadota bacterium]